MNYIIYSPGRTGSCLIAGDLSLVLPNHLVYYSSDPKHRLKIQADGDLQEVIIHSHQPYFYYNFNKDNFTAIISKRKDEFATTISLLTANFTKQFGPYPNTEFPPFYTSIEEFEMSLRSIRRFYTTLDINGFCQVIDIWYEDLITQPSYLRSSLKISNQPMSYTNYKSPYGQSLIKNLEELKNHYESSCK